MSAIRLINAVPSSISSAAEFRVQQGTNRIARIGIHPGAEATIPTTADRQVPELNEGRVSTAQQWTVYAIVNGITTATVAFTDPNATVTLSANNNDEGFSLLVS